MKRKLSKQAARRGISVVVALVALAVVAATVLVFGRTVVVERRYNADRWNHFQAESLIRDAMNVTEKEKRNLELTIPKEYLDGISDLRLESEVRDLDDRSAVTVRLRTTNDELPKNLRMDLTRKNDHAKQNDTKK